MSKKKKEHYVDNKKFLEAMIEFRNHVQACERNDMPRPVVPNYIGDCLFKIATHLSHSPNFSRYSFREDMIMDGVENCLLYIDNFDPKKSSNPFSYFTQIIYFAFLRRLEKEKKILYTKYKAIENYNIMDEVSGREWHQHITMSEGAEDYMNQFILDFEEKKRKKRRPKE